MDTLLPFIVVGISVGAVYALSGVGLVVLYRASGVVNFAFGALGGLAAMVCWQLIDLEYDDWMGWVAGIGVATLLSWAYGRFIAPSLTHQDRVVRAMATAQELPLESEESPKTCVTLEDSFAPARPGNLNVIAGAGAMNLIWDPNAEPDVVGYVVFRALGNETPLAPITPRPVDMATYRDVVAPGTRVTYAIQAVDRAGNVSPLSEPVVEVAR